jgi:hypothetical protein
VGFGSERLGHVLHFSCTDNRSGAANLQACTDHPPLGI